MLIVGTKFNEGETFQFSSHKFANETWLIHFVRWEFYHAMINDVFYSFWNHPILPLIAFLTFWRIIMSTWAVLFWRVYPVSFVHWRRCSAATEKWHEYYVWEVYRELFYTVCACDVWLCNGNVNNSSLLPDNELFN